MTVMHGRTHQLWMTQRKHTAANSDAALLFHVNAIRPADGLRQDHLQHAWIQRCYSFLLQQLLRCCKAPELCLLYPLTFHNAEELSALAYASQVGRF